ncbi:MAG: 3-deoxy-D-manno-octulosonic acid transferase [Pseudomonadota bacterium]
MMFPLYTLGYGAAVLTASPFYLVRGLRSGKYWWSLPDRLGLRRPRLPKPEKDAPRIWLHALSLGEVVSAAPLAERLLGLGCEVCLSTTTRSGFEIARKSIPSDAARLPFPLDWPPAIRRIQRSVRPDLFVLVETDVWPNFLAGLKQAGVPAVLVGGRISPRSLAGYRLIKGFWKRVLDLFACIGCQTQLDRERILSLGARPEKVVVTGNLKFDRPIPESGPEMRKRLLAQTGLPDRPWLVAGSTHPGEDEIILRVYGRLKAGQASLGLILAPRNRERFEPVWRLIITGGHRAGRRTGPAPTPETEVFLLDTYGELDGFYELADVVFVGKSLPVPGEGGGHNLLEPAARSKPVLFGPRMHNFPAVAQAMSEAGGGRQVADEEELYSTLDELLSQPARRTDMGRRAKRVIEEHRGALDRTMDLIKGVLPHELGA